MGPIGVIVPEFNELSKGSLERGLIHLEKLAQNGAFHVIIVDDASTDGSTAEILRFVESRSPGFLFLSRKKNGAKVAAIRDGVRSLPPTTRIVLLTDFDTVFSTNTTLFLHDLCKTLESDPSFHAGALRVEPLEQGLWRTFQKYDYLMGRIYHKILRNEAKTRCISGAGGIWERKVLEELLMMHSGRHNGDDLELTVLLCKHGYQVRYFSQIILETATPSSYLALLRQRSRWQLGALVTYLIQWKFILTELLGIFKLRYYGLLLFWELVLSQPNCWQDRDGEA